MASPRSSFTTLPIDAVLCIADVTPTRELNALSRTCRSLYETLNPIIYNRHAHDPNVSILAWAAKWGRVGTSRKALKAGADINKQEPFPDTILFPAGGPIGIPDENGCYQYGSPWAGQTPLQIAVALRHEALIRFLLNNGANVHLCHWGSSPILLAAQHPAAPKIARMILDRGADVNATSYNGKLTALHLALRQNVGRGLLPNFDLVRLLLRRGADMHAKDGKGRTPKDMACVCEDRIRVLFDDRVAGNKVALYEAGLTDKKPGGSVADVSRQQALHDRSESRDQKEDKEPPERKIVKRTKKEPARVDDSFDWAAVRKRAMESEKKGSKRKSKKK